MLRQIYLFFKYLPSYSHIQTNKQLKKYMRYDPGVAWMHQRMIIFVYILILLGLISKYYLQ